MALVTATNGDGSTGLVNSKPSGMVSAAAAALHRDVDRALQFLGVPSMMPAKTPRIAASWM